MHNKGTEITFPCETAGCEVLDPPQYAELIKAEMSSIQMRRRYWDDYNRTDEAIRSSTLHQLFIEQCARTPENTAIILGEVRLTYAELDRRSNQVAQYLKTFGIVAGDFVGVAAKRVPGSIVNLLGILKAGATYIPIKPDCPAERVTYILQNSESKLLLEQDFYETHGLNDYTAAPVNEGRPENLAYVIYTSGSTGTPKGVMITHQSAANTVIDINQKFDITAESRLIGLASLSFDLSVYDVFGALSTGASLVLVPDQRDMQNVLAIIETHGITFWNSVPAVMKMLVDYMDDRGLAFQGTSLKSVLLSGDWIPVALPDRIRTHFPNAQVVSLGGATEASIWSIYYPIEKVDPDWKSIPYGKPLANQKFYVLDETLALCALDAVGELYIGGFGVAQGYLNDAAKTTSAFIHHAELGILYKTGDFGALRKDGNIEFLGRMDTQVKINGYRVELGEIEYQIKRHPAVNDAIVAAKDDDNGKRYLAAYVVLRYESEAQELKSFLTGTLPPYMIPSRYVFLSHFPLSGNAKVDRNQFSDPG